MPYTILGIDPGTRATGYGLITLEAQPQLLAHGLIKPKPSLPIEHRLHWIHQELLELIDDHQPTMIAVEEPYFGKSAKSSMAVGQAQTVALIAAASRNIPIEKYPPAQVKQRITGTGAATKEQVRTAVRMMLQAPASISIDTADAIAVAHCAVTAEQERRALSRTMAS